MIPVHPIQCLLLLAALLPPVALAATDPNQTLTPEPLGPNAAWDYVQDAKGRLWIAYYDPARRLMLRRPNGAIVGVSGDDRNQAPSGLGLTTVGDQERVAVLWRDKLPSKGLFLWTSDAAADLVENLDQGSAPLGRILAASRADRLDALWYGEQPDPATEVTYHLYYRSQALDTGEFSPMEQVLPGIYPTWALAPDGTIMVASWTFGDDPAGIAVRFRDPETGEFGPRRVVAQDVEITPLIRAFRSADRWFVLWHAQHRDDPARPFSLHLAYTDDEGETWTQQDIEALRGYDLASADIATDDDGRILVAVDALDRSGNQRSAKMGVWLIRSLDRGSSWSVENLRAGETMSAFHARNPSVALGPGKDQALVIWEDWQTIRPRLFGSLTEDNGESWRVAHQLLPNQPEGNLRLRFSVSSVYLSDGSYQVIAEQYADSFREKHLVQFGFTPAELLAASPSDGATAAAPAADAPAADSPTEDATSEDADSDRRDDAEDARLGALRERVLSFWQAMEAEDFASAYHFYDPFFRALNSEQRFTALTGKITYADYATNHINLTGALAEVTGTVRANVIPFRMPTTGELIEQDERWVPIQDTWLWIDGQWYREFYSEGKDLKYTRY